MRGGCLNALVVCALVNVSAVAGVMPAAGHPVGAGQLLDAGLGPNIDACIKRLDPQLDIGYDRIAARCPELMRQLEGGTWAPWLPRGWQEPGNDLSAGGLKEFRELVDRQSAARELTVPVAPDVHSLQPILTALTSSRGESAWSRLESWLRSILERREQPTDESWLSRMVSHVGVSQSVLRLGSYAALAAVVLLAGIIVVNEVRTAGLFPQQPTAARRRRGLAAAVASGMSWADIEQAPIRERPRLLLELILRRLNEHRFLPPAGALTVRELTRAARLPEAEDRSRLQDLGLAAERVRYCAGAVGAGAGGAAQSQVEGLDEPIERGRELLDRLDRGAVAPLNEDETG